MKRIFVWDGAMRLFHWLLVTAVLTAYFTPERVTTLHVIAGYLVVALLAFRLVWGIAGTEHARFRDFLPNPGAAIAHVRGLMRGEPRHTPGHNPTSALGAWALLLLLAATVLTAVLPVEALHHLHGLFANLTIAAAVLHVIGLIVEDALTGEGIIASMVHGFKTMPEELGERMRASGPIPRHLLRATLAAILVLLSAGLATGVLPWPAGKEHEHDHDRAQIEQVETPAAGLVADRTLSQ
ncbi:cytochrome b/b6 domain-containing protein [Rhodovibrio salinarum]|nr:cytochrome b/b6 domain-containing protein [Rhodovibrio salinarum]